MTFDRPLRGHVLALKVRYWLHISSENEAVTFKMNHLILRVKITMKNLSVYTVSIPNKRVVVRQSTRIYYKTCGEH